MMDVEELVRNLRHVEQGYAEKRYAVGEVRVCDMAKDCANALEALQAEKEDTGKRLIELADKMNEIEQEAKIMIERDERLKAIVEQYEIEVVPMANAIIEALNTENITLRAERDALLKSFKVKPVGLEERGD